MPQWQNAEEKEIIEAARNGDYSAYGQLYETHLEGVFRYLYGHLSNRQDAEDLAEEVFLRVWRSLHRYHEQGVPFAAYLYRVARNVLIDHYRRSSSKDTLPLREDLLCDPSEDPSTVAAANAQREQIRQILGELREDYQTVLTLRFLSELSPDEVAQVMGRSSGAIRVLQHRALAALRKLLEGSAR